MNSLQERIKFVNRGYTVSASSGLSVRPHETTRLTLDGFIWNLIFHAFSKKKSRNFKFYSHRTTITCTLHEDQYTFLIISRSILLRMRNVSDKSCIGNQNTHFGFKNRFFLSKILRLWDNVEKYFTVWQARDDKWRMRTCCIAKATHTHTHTHTEYVIPVAFPLTIVAKTSLNVTSHVHCPSYDERKNQRNAFFQKVTVYLKYQFAPTCFGASGAPSSRSPK
jgi:hypothetical protein